MKRYIRSSERYTDTDFYLVRIWYKKGNAPVVIKKLQVASSGPDEAYEIAATQIHGKIVDAQVKYLYRVDLDPDEPILRAKDAITTFRDYVDNTRYPGFDVDGLTDEEYYELEDEYRASVPAKYRESNYK